MSPERGARMLMVGGGGVVGASGTSRSKKHPTPQPSATVAKTNALAPEGQPFGTPSTGMPALRCAEATSKPAARSALSHHAFERTRGVGKDTARPNRCQEAWR